MAHLILIRQPLLFFRCIYSDTGLLRAFRRRTQILVDSPDEIERLGDVKLMPGMPVEVFIRTHERTALSYLVRPVHDQIARAFKEK